MNEKIAYRVVDTPTPRYVMFSGRFKRFEKGLLIIYYIFIACFIFFCIVGVMLIERCRSIYL